MFTIKIDKINSFWVNNRVAQKKHVLDFWMPIDFGWTKKDIFGWRGSFGLQDFFWATLVN